MLSGLFWSRIGLSLAAVVIALVVLMWALARRRNARTGATGLVQRSRLLCPKCGRTFDYEWVPGAALSAIRLGSSRYLACPICHAWSTFDVARAEVPPPSPPSAPPAA